MWRLSSKPARPLTQFQPVERRSIRTSIQALNAPVGRWIRFVMMAKECAEYGGSTQHGCRRLAPLSLRSRTTPSRWQHSTIPFSRAEDADSVTAREGDQSSTLPLGPGWGPEGRAAVWRSRPDVSRSATLAVTISPLGRGPPVWSATGAEVPADRCSGDHSG